MALDENKKTPKEKPPNTDPMLSNNDAESKSSSSFDKYMKEEREDTLAFDETKQKEDSSSKKQHGKHARPSKWRMHKTQEEQDVEKDDYGGNEEESTQQSIEPNVIFPSENASSEFPEKLKEMMNIFEQEPTEYETADPPKLNEQTKNTETNNDVLPEEALCFDEEDETQGPPKWILVIASILLVASVIILGFWFGKAYAATSSKQPAAPATYSQAPNVPVFFRNEYEFPEPTATITPTATPTTKPKTEITIALFAHQQNLGIDLYGNPVGKKGQEKIKGVPLKVELECLSLSKVKDKDNQSSNKASVVGAKTEYEINKKNGGVIVMDLAPGEYRVSVLTDDASYIIPEPKRITVKERIDYKADDNIKVEEEDEGSKKEDGTENGREEGGDDIVIGPVITPTPVPTPEPTPVPTPDPTPEPTPSYKVVQKSDINGEIITKVYKITDGQWYTGVNPDCQYLYHANGDKSPYYAIWDSSKNYLILARYDKAQADALTAPETTPDTSSSETQKDASEAPEAASISRKKHSAMRLTQSIANVMEKTGILQVANAEEMPDIKLYDEKLGTLQTCDNFMLTAAEIGSGKYSGWVVDAAGTHYYDPATNKQVVGETVIIGDEVCQFNENGILEKKWDLNETPAPTETPESTPTPAETPSPTTPPPSGGIDPNALCIDVSSHQGNIDWEKVSNAGIKHAIIRVGYRGYKTGKLVEDSRAAYNIQQARANGIQVGLYVFDQSVNEEEAVQEASLAIKMAKKYGCDMQIYIDSEWSGGNPGRGDNISVEQRTSNLMAFCETVKNAGYAPGVYASASWYKSHVLFDQLRNYHIWVAHYTSASKPSFAHSYYLWQFTSKGKIDGISTNVDVNRFG